jgi:hypothetical protein
MPIGCATSRPTAPSSTARAARAVALSPAAWRPARDRPLHHRRRDRRRAGQEQPKSAPRRQPAAGIALVARRRVAPPIPRRDMLPPGNSASPVHAGFIDWATDIPGLSISPHRCRPFHPHAAPRRRFRLGALSAATAGPRASRSRQSRRRAVPSRPAAGEQSLGRSLGTGCGASAFAPPPAFPAQQARRPCRSRRRVRAALRQGRGLFRRMS